jgi:hypothetical protein
MRILKDKYNNYNSITNLKINVLLLLLLLFLWCYIQGL